MSAEQECLRPAVPAARPISFAPSERKKTNVFKHRTYAANNFRRKTAVPAGEGDDGSDIARDEEKFRNGLKRNIAHLSNLTRVTQEELARLREKLKAKDREINALKERVNKGGAEECTRERRDLASSIKHESANRRRMKTLAAYGNLTVMVQRLASDVPQESVTRSPKQPSGQDPTKEELVVAALGAKHTEQQLLRASREIRGQLERALQESEALRADKIALKFRADLAEKEKADLQTRVACLSDEIKLHIAPLTALHLELTQARSEAEGTRQRLKEERRESRIRIGDLENASRDAEQRAERLEFDLEEISKALQRETAKASKYERMHQEASAATSALQEEVEQRKADASVIAQELTRMQAEIGKSDPLPLATAARAAAAAEKAESEELAKERLRGDQQQDEIKSLKASIAQLHLKQAAFGGLKKTMSERHRSEVEERENAIKSAEERADSLAMENSRLSLVMKKQEDEYQKAEEERHHRNAESENTASEGSLRSNSVIARLCRTLHELCDAEEAGELVLTCLKCTKLFRDPYIVGPCGHTLCAKCCGGGGGEQVGSGGGGSITPRKSDCHLCINQPRESKPTDERLCAAGMVPNRALAILVSKFAFRRQLLDSLQEIANALRREGLQMSQDSGDVDV